MKRNLLLVIMLSFIGLFGFEANTYAQTHRDIELQSEGAGTPTLKRSSSSDVMSRGIDNFEYETVTVTTTIKATIDDDDILIVCEEGADIDVQILNSATGEIVYINNAYVNANTPLLISMWGEEEGKYEIIIRFNGQKVVGSFTIN